MRKTTQKTLKSFKKYWLYLILLSTGLVITLVLDHYWGCNFIILRDVKQCTVLGQSSWEWIKLLIGPILVALTGIVLNRYFKIRDEKRQEQGKEIEEDRLKQEALIKYLDQMTDFFQGRYWLTPSEDPKIINAYPGDITTIALAKARTFAVLNELDGRRKGSVIIFLRESKVFHHISFEKANLIGVNLYKAYLSKINLSQADLTEGDLVFVNLSDAKLIGTDLTGANLYGAILLDVDLSYANLKGASLIDAFLNNADLKGTDLSGAYLKGANLSTTQNLTTQQVKKANNWQEAIFSEDFHKELGLPPTPSPDQTQEESE